MSKVRYRIDPYRMGIVDENTGLTVCGVAEAEQYFSQKKSLMRGRVAALDQLIAELESQKAQMQARCRHPHATYDNRGDTGNWSRSDDRYWTEFCCYDCGRRWTEDQ